MENVLIGPDALRAMDATIPLESTPPERKTPNGTSATRWLATASSKAFPELGDPVFLGPTWKWPGFQPPVRLDSRRRAAILDQYMTRREFAHLPVDRAWSGDVEQRKILIERQPSSRVKLCSPHGQQALEFTREVELAPLSR